MGNRKAFMVADKCVDLGPKQLRVAVDILKILFGGDGKENTKMVFDKVIPEKAYNDIIQIYHETHSEFFKRYPKSDFLIGNPAMLKVIYLAFSNDKSAEAPNIDCSGYGANLNEFEKNRICKDFIKAFRQNIKKNDELANYLDKIDAQNNLSELKTNMAEALKMMTEIKLMYENSIKEKSEKLRTKWKDDNMTQNKKIIGFDKYEYDLFTELYVPIWNELLNWKIGREIFEKLNDGVSITDEWNLSIELFQLLLNKVVPLIEKYLFLITEKQVRDFFYDLLIYIKEVEIEDNQTNGDMLSQIAGALWEDLEEFSFKMFNIIDERVKNGLLFAMEKSES